MWSIDLLIVKKWEASQSNRDADLRRVAWRCRMVTRICLFIFFLLEICFWSLGLFIRKKGNCTGIWLKSRPGNGLGNRIYCTPSPSPQRLTDWHALAYVPCKSLNPRAWGAYLTWGALLTWSWFAFPTYGVYLDRSRRAVVKWARALLYSSGHGSGPVTSYIYERNHPERRWRSPAQQLMFYDLKFSAFVVAFTRWSWISDTSPFTCIHIILCVKTERLQFSIK